MDYDVKLNKLSSKLKDLEELISGSEDVYNEFNSCYLNSINCAELSSLKSILKQPIER